MGIVVPMEWDTGGNPSAWAISTYDEDLYRIDTTTEKGQALGSLLGCKIQLSGMLYETGGSNYRIIVDTYLILDDKQSLR